MRHWRQPSAPRLEAIAAHYPPRAPVALAGLADLATVALEGGYVLGRGLEEPDRMVRQLRLLRQRVELTFQRRG